MKTMLLIVCTNEKTPVIEGRFSNFGRKQVPRTRMKNKLHLLLFLLLAGTVHGQEDSIFKIAFGSCGHQDHPLPIFNTIVTHQPDVFVFLGDNIYGDTKNMDTLRAKYNRLAAKPSFQNLKKTLKSWRLGTTMITVRMTPDATMP